MTIATVRELLGLGSIPKHRTSATEWLKRHNVPIARHHGRGGAFETVSLLDLPEDVETAYRLKLAEEAGLAFGEQDDAAHLALMAKPVGVQATAHARAKVLGLVYKGARPG